MRETERRRKIGFDEFGGPIFEDEYHPDYPVAQPLERAKKPRRLSYKEALKREIQDIVEQTGANRPHHPCG